MENSLVYELAEFAHATKISDMPSEVIEESKRILLDSIGCAFSGISHKRGRIGADFAGVMGGKGATILATGQRASAFGAAFANAEAINALDFDVVLPPGHVSPYVLPPALATAEEKKSSGDELIIAIAVAHEMSNRIGKAMDYHRDIKDGQVVPPKVWGFASTVLGGAAATARLRGMDKGSIAHAISIAAMISPVNSASAWREHANPTTIKYALGGWFSQTALTAAHLAELGHRGDMQIFDPEYGYPKFIGTSRWSPESVTKDLGKKWNFPQDETFKHYPHCRVLAAPLDALTFLIKKHNIAPEEIDKIEALVEGFLDRPLWSNRNIVDETDGQFSVAHGLATGAHGFVPGAAWQDPVNVFSPSVLELMGKVTYSAHPDYITALERDPHARPTRVTVHARGQIFTEDRTHPRGTSDPERYGYFTTPDLIDKFLINSANVMSDRNAIDLSQMIMNISDIDDINDLTNFIAKSVSVA